MDYRRNFFLTVFLLAVVTGSLLYLISFDELEGFSEAKDISVYEDMLIFSTHCFELEMHVSVSQAEHIELALTRARAEAFDTGRPMMSELTAKIIETSDMEMKRVEIHSLQNNSYMADIILTNDERIDTRPSDAVLLAAELDKPVFLSDELLREEGRNTCLEGSQSI